jgi:transposase-like protein
MAGRGHKISHEIKTEILQKIKEAGQTVAETARQYGVSDKTIHGWLKTGSTPGASYTEINKLKRQNQQLVLTIGFYAARELAAKKGMQPDHWLAP